MYSTLLYSRQGKSGTRSQAHEVIDARCPESVRNVIFTDYYKVEVGDPGFPRRCRGLIITEQDI